MRNKLSNFRGEPVGGQAPAPHPLRPLLIAGASILVCETALMFALAFFPPGLPKELLNAILLIVLVSPTLYFLLFKPLALADTANRRNKKKLNELFCAVEQSPVATLITNQDGVIQYANDRFYQLTGYNWEETIGQTPRFLKSGDQPLAFYKELWGTILAGREWRGEFHNRRKNGELYWVNAIITPVKDEKGEVSNFVALEEDITDKRLLAYDLVESEEKYLKLFATVPDAILFSEIQTHRITDANQAACELYQYTLEEMRQLRVQDISAEPEKTLTAIDTAPAQGIVHIPLRYHKKKDGTVFPAEITGGAIVLDGQKRIFSVCRDITARKSMEDDLRLAHERFQLAVSGSRDGLWDWSTKFDDPPWWSPQFYNLLGYEDREFAATLPKFFEILHPGDKERVAEAINSHIKTKGSPPYDIDYRLRTKSGEYRWFQARGQAQWDENGMSIRMAGSLRDISEFIKTQDALRESEERFRDAFEAAAIGMALVGLDGTFLKVNRSLCEIVGYPEQELQRRTFQSITHPDDLDIDLGLAKKLVAGDIPYYHLEKRYIHKQGHAVWIRLSGSVVRDKQGTPIYFVAQIEDITERKRLEEELKKHSEKLEVLVAQRTQELKNTYDQLLHAEKLSAVGKLAGAIAHEFNNPIYGVRNILEQVQMEKNLAPDIKALTQIAIKECNRMAELVRKMIDFYRPASTEIEPMSIHEAISDVLMLSRRKLEAKKIAVEKVFDPDIPVIHAVASQIRQVILNLVQNAEEAIATETGGKIRIMTEKRDTSIRISIQDNGRGIPRDNFPHIFEPFFSTKSAVKETGLGLSVSHGILKSHGGDITVESEEGKGATFVITLPVKANTKRSV